jgi:hypothetical protein
MKKLLNLCIILLSILVLSGCRRSVEFNPANGVSVQLDIQTEFIILNSKSTKAGEMVTKAYSLNLRDTFVKRYNIDITKLDSFMVNSLTVGFKQDRCKKLQTYNLNLALPIIDPYIVKDKCGAPILGTFAIVDFSDPLAATFYRQLTTTNFASALKSSSPQPININFKMTAKEDFGDEDFVLVVILSTRATYRP